MCILITGSRWKLLPKKEVRIVSNPSRTGNPSLKQRHLFTDFFMIEKNKNISQTKLHTCSFILILKIILLQKPGEIKKLQKLYIQKVKSWDTLLGKSNKRFHRTCTTAGFQET